MKYIDYKEHKQHGTFNFPIAYYRENPRTPRYLMQYHWHPEYEIVHIISGSFEIMVNNNPVLCREGDVILLTDGFLHGGTPHDCVYEGVIFDFFSSEGESRLHQDHSEYHRPQIPDRPEALGRQSRYFAGHRGAVRRALFQTVRL